MRITTSPGMNRMIENTMMLTSSSVGTASATRRSTYCFMTGRPLLVDPGEHQPGAEAEAVVVLEALHVRRVRDVLRRVRQVHVVRLVREVALDVVNQVQALLRIELAPLRDQHLVELGVGDGAAVVGLLREEAAVEPVVDFRERRDRPDRHLL